jgi:transposase InsO family protein
MPETGKISQTWLTTKQVSGLMGISPRSVRRKIGKELQGKPTENGYLFELIRLPQKIQRKYQSERSNAGPRESLPELKQWQRDIAFERLDILGKWEGFAKEHNATLNQVVDEFVREYNETHPDKKISRGTLFRWRKVKKEKGVAGLCPKWTNGKEALGDAVFSPEAKQFANDLWLHPNRPTKKNCYFHLEREAKKKGWKIPSFSSMKRFWNAIPRPVEIYHREGEKAFEDKACPSILRQTDNLKPMDVVVGDHHQVDIAVIFPDGRIGFPWLTAWKDVKSRKMVAWALVSTPSSDSINISFQEMVLGYGVPFKGHLDNGRDYKAQAFTGVKRGKLLFEMQDIKVSYNEARIGGIYNDLGMKIIWARKRNAKSKIVERWFKTLVNDFSVWWKGFRGRNIKEKPENLKDEWKKRDLVTLDELKQGMQAFINFYNSKRPHQGIGDRTPDSVFFELLEFKRAVRAEELSLLCSRSAEKTVQKEGIELFNDWYRHPELQFKYLKRKVRIRYYEDDITKVFVFERDGRFICIADKYNDAQWGMESEDFRKHYRWKKVVYESTKEWNKHNLGERLSKEGRQRLIISLAPLKKKEPKVKEIFLETKYAVILAEMEQLEEQKQQRLKELNEYAKKYAALDDPGNDVDVKKYYDKFGRLE